MLLLIVGLAVVLMARRNWKQNMARLFPVLGLLAVLSIVGYLMVMVSEPHPRFW